MATTDTQRNGADDATVDFSVNLQLRMADTDCSPDELEDRGITIHEAVVQHAGHLALGCVVSSTFDPPTVVLEFDTEARDLVDAYQMTAQVLEIIAREIPGIRIDAGGMQAEPHKHELELVPA